MPTGTLQPRKQEYYTQAGRFPETGNKINLRK